MKYFAVDIGSNTIMLSIMEKLPLNNAVSKPLPQAQSPTNPANLSAEIKIATFEKNGYSYKDYLAFASLAKGIATSKKISDESLEKACLILSAYKEIITTQIDLSLYPLQTVATSALREATNQKEVIAKLESALGSKISIISGQDEGLLTYCGVVCKTSSPAIVIDIGGGSTEITFGKGTEPKKAISLPIGAVKWLGEFSHKKLQNPSSIIKCQQKIISLFDKWVQSHFSSTQMEPYRHATIYGVAGIPTTIAACMKKINLSDLSSIDGTILTLKGIKHWKEIFLQASIEQLANDNILFKAVDKNRAKIMSLSAIILETLLKLISDRFNTPSNMEVSVGGLRYGVLHSLLTGK